MHSYLGRMRLWCCMEIFTFLTMGGEVAQITMLPLDPNVVGDEVSTGMKK